MAYASEEHVPTRWGLYVKVWAALVVLTGVTVGVSYADLAGAATLTALLIAVVKVSLVMLYFMHLRFEPKLFAGLLGGVILTYGVFIGLTLVDYLMR